MWRTFRAIFTTRGSRFSVSGLLLAMAMIPVVEILVIRMFSSLIINGPQQYQDDPASVVRKAVIFFVAFAGSRGLHHALRFVRVRVFRQGFEASAEKRSPSQESWEWALAFELSNIVVGVIQTFAFSALFLVISWQVGLFNVVVCAAVFWIISMIYGRQLHRQVGYITTGTKPGSVSISEKVGSRIRDAEFGSALSSFGMAFALGAVLLQTVRGELGSSDAIVLFLGLRLLYGQVGHLSGGVMRFARALARRNTPPPTRPAPRKKTTAPSKHRGRLIEQTLAAGRAGDATTVAEFGERLSSTGRMSVKEQAAVTAAASFAAYAAPVDDPASDPVPLMWTARPFPGNFGGWLSPLVLRDLTGLPVQFVSPQTDSPPLHLSMSGSIGRYVTSTSIVAGTGVSSPDVPLHPGAIYHSLRGPLTAESLRSQGGPAIDSFGDPALLVARALPLNRGETNGRIALVRDPAHLDAPLALPEHLTELDILGSGPDDIRRLLTEMVDHDAVVTSALHVLVACHAYGVPCALVTFEGLEDAVTGSGMRYRDYSLGAGLDAVWEPQVVPLDLTGVTWDDLLDVETVSEDKLDEISAAVQDAVESYQVLSTEVEESEIDAEA